VVIVRLAWPTATAGVAGDQIAVAGLARPCRIPKDAMVRTCRSGAVRHVDVDHVVARRRGWGPCSRTIVAAKEQVPTPEVPLDIRLEAACCGPKSWQDHAK